MPKKIVVVYEMDISDMDPIDIEKTWGTRDPDEIEALEAERLTHADPWHEGYELVGVEVQ